MKSATIEIDLTNKTIGDVNALNEALIRDKCQISAIKLSPNPVLSKLVVEYSDPEFKPGDRVVTSLGHNATYIAAHPEHPCHILDVDEIGLFAVPLCGLMTKEKHEEAQKKLDAMRDWAKTLGYQVPQGWMSNIYDSGLTIAKRGE